MIKNYTLWIHWKQGDTFGKCERDFSKWAAFLNECTRQVTILSEYKDKIEVTGADTHYIGLQMEESLANELIAQDVNLSLEEWDDDGEDEG